MKHWKIQDYCRIFPISFVLRSFYISRKSIANMLRQPIRSINSNIDASD